MAIYYLDDGLKEAFRLAKRKEKWALLESQKKATELMKKTVDGELSLAAVQGPPGTGKTSVVEAFAKEELPDFVTQSENELILYIAPTNHLVYEAFKRISAQLIKKGFDIQSLLSVVRVYGSKIKPMKEKEVIIGDKKLERDDLNRLVSNVDNNVRIIFATEFQRVSSRLEVEPKRIHIVADEASKSPYFRVFLPLAEKIAKNPEEYYPYTLLVLGDPQQAITVPEEFTIMDVPLLMKLTERVLKENDLKKDCWVMLDTTFRLPRPSEDPISHGFYRGKLHVHYTSRERLEIIKDSILDNISRITSALDKAGVRATSLDVKKIVDGIEEAITSNIPIVVVKTRPFKSGDTYDEERVKKAFIISSIFQLASHFSGYSFSVTTTAPYCDIVDSIAFKFHRRFHNFGSIRAPRAVTVQSLIGGESDVIVAPLGKEWLPSEIRYHPSEEFTTIYAREPELLNVQMSRHRSLMVVIGNTDRLMNQRERRIQRTVERLEELEGKGTLIIS